MPNDRKPIYEGVTPQDLSININGANPQITNIYGVAPQNLGDSIHIRGVMPQPLGGSIQGGVQPQHTSETSQLGGKPPAHE